MMFFLKVVLTGAIVFVGLSLYYDTLSPSPVHEAVDYLSWESITTSVEVLETPVTETWIQIQEGRSTWELLIQEAIDEIRGTTKDVHYASYTSLKEFKRKFQQVCVENILVCVKLSFEWNYTYQEKFMYLASTIHILNFMDRYDESPEETSQVLTLVRLNKNGGERRGYATKDTVEVNIELVESYSEFLELITHELWHIYDLGVLQWNSRRKDEYYTEFGDEVFAIDDPSIDFYKISWRSEKVRRPSMDRENFCSGYGASDPFEDIAECINMYINHHALFKYLANKNDSMREKYNFIAENFDGKYLFNNAKDLQLVRNNINWRPWDTTRIN